MTNEQWQELVRLYGDNAYLMCEWRNKPNEFENQNSPCFKWRDDLQGNYEINSLLDNLDLQELRIKKSAALPFDLVATMSLDKVEIFVHNEWVLCEPNYAIYLAKLGKSEMLRMKYPRRIGVNYETK